ncbi:vesicle transport through interaction with t-SNAREs homolog 1A isoform X5 [Myotis yumanensis]|uniref:vesicle transport through interaction with t-SNAREs homolog 1A isoform X5 n=1 Tax=Myotis yumanensis TaxID=159337 RepID=UPI0038D4681C
MLKPERNLKSVPTQFPGDGDCDGQPGSGRARSCLGFSALVSRAGPRVPIPCSPAPRYPCPDLGSGLACRSGAAMSSDFEGFEQDFAVLTAEITSKIARVPRLPPDEKKQMVANVEKQLEEAKELLEQMDLEVREIPPQSRGMYSNRMRSYKQEMGKLETDFKAHSNLAGSCMWDLGAHLEILPICELPIIMERLTTL